MELDESSQLSCSVLSSSPPNGRLSPPTIMSSGQGGGGQGGSGGQQPSNLTPMPQQQSPQESYELQIDYWPVMQRAMEASSKEAKSANKTIDQGKNSIKSTFRSLQVWRLPPYKQSMELLSSHGLTLLYATKEKKQKSEWRVEI